jgi:hypothetical protein
MRSAWLKWARAVEHQQTLARETWLFAEKDSYEYTCFNNSSAPDDRLVRMHWRLKIKEPYPERWSILIGDALTNLRAALDHALWSAVLAQSGPPTTWAVRPERVQFPIASTEQKFKEPDKMLASMVSPDIWDVVKAVQPFHGGTQAHTVPLEILRWLSNVDKHRAVHIVGRTHVDLGPIQVASSSPLEVVEEWRLEGPAEDGAVVARLKLKRPTDSQPIDIAPTFAHEATLQICDTPQPDYRTLASVMEITKEHVFNVLAAFSTALDVAPPDGLDLGTGDRH